MLWAGFLVVTNGNWSNRRWGIEPRTLWSIINMHSSQLIQRGICCGWQTRTAIYIRDITASFNMVPDIGKQWQFYCPSKITLESIFMFSDGISHGQKYGSSWQCLCQAACLKGVPINHNTWFQHFRAKMFKYYSRPKLPLIWKKCYVQACHSIFNLKVQN